MTKILLGIGFGLVVFKLAEVIDWSWWWVTLPLWIKLMFEWVLAQIILVGYLAHLDKKDKRLLERLIRRKMRESENDK